MRPIGVFDSGMGGLSILREIRRILPDEDLVYFADTAYCPYGPREKAELRRLAGRIARFLLADRPSSLSLVDPRLFVGAKLIVVACNTASVAALEYLRESFAAPFVGVVPAVKPAAALSRTRHVAVLATPATFQGEMFDNLVHQFAEHVRVDRQVCPGLVELVERGETSSQATRELLQRYLDPSLSTGADTVVLGCTHYPFLRPLVEEIVGKKVAVIDSGEAVARQVRRVLEREGLLCSTSPGDLDERAEGEGKVLYYTSSPEVEKLRPIFGSLCGVESPLVRFADPPLGED